MRENTEWTETVELGANHLTGANTQKIVSTACQVIEQQEQVAKRLKELPNPFGDGKASEKILKAVKSYLTESR